MVDNNYVSIKEALLKRTSLTDAHMLKLEAVFDDAEGNKELVEILEELLKLEDISFVNEDFIDQIIDVRMKELADRKLKELELQHASELGAQEIRKMSQSTLWDYANLIFNYLIFFVIYVGVTAFVIYKFPEMKNPYYFLVAFIFINVVTVIMVAVRSQKEYKELKAETQRLRELTMNSKMPEDKTKPTQTDET